MGHMYRLWYRLFISRPSRVSIWSALFLKDNTYVPSALAIFLWVIYTPFSINAARYIVAAIRTEGLPPVKAAISFS